MAAAVGKRVGGGGGGGGLMEIASCTVKDAATWLRDYLTAIKHGQFHPYTPLERKVREATRNEAW